MAANLSGPTLISPVVGAQVNLKNLAAAALSGGSANLPAVKQRSTGESRGGGQEHTSTGYSVDVFTYSSLRHGYLCLPVPEALSARQEGWKLSR